MKNQESRLKKAIKSMSFYSIFIFTGLLGLMITVSFHIPNHLQSEGFSTTLSCKCSYMYNDWTNIGEIPIGLVKR